MKFFDPLRNTKGYHWKDAGIWLTYTLIGSLAPVLFGFLLLRLLSRHPSLADFSAHGEFAIYSAAMFAPAYYIINRDLKIPGFAWRQYLALLTLIGMLGATCFFVAVNTAFLAPKPVFAIDQEFLRVGTLALFAAAAILAFLVTVLDNARLQPDVRAIASTQEEDLARDFDKLGGAQ